MKASFGFVTPLNKVVTLKKYWKVRRITCLEYDLFWQNSTTECLKIDFWNKLILEISFYLKQKISALQFNDLSLVVNMVNLGNFLFKKSFKDHVGLILRYSTGEIVLFEATGREGVGLCRWKTFMRCKWHLLYSK